MERTGRSASGMQSEWLREYSILKARPNASNIVHRNIVRLTARASSSKQY
jgi:hypothetical protein